MSGVLFDGHTPALRKLELINYAFLLTSPTLCGLTSHRLRDLGPSFQPTLAELRAALSRMQDLADLHLENALPSAFRDPAGLSFKSREKLSFPHLSRPSILAPLSTVIHLLSCCSIPLETDVRLRCCFETGGDDYTPIHPLLAKQSIASKISACFLVPIIHICFTKTTLAIVGFIFSTAECDWDRHAFSANTTSSDLGLLHEDWNCNIPLKLDVELRSSLSQQMISRPLYEAFVAMCP